MNVLALDTATPYLVIGTLNTERAIWRGRKHAETIFDDVEEFLAGADYTCEQIELVVVGEGPGSYTGLRVGAAAGTSIARALNVPLVGVSSLAAIACRRSGRVRPVLSARSGHVYTALYEVKNGQPALLAEPVKLETSDLPEDACLLVDVPPSGIALARLGKAAYEAGSRGLNSVYL
ncbi:tRNA (adenosine(37)-N6)-threonylcarbamoyltransferase complex dimerization subunit type 1 TsaB [Oceanithermus sp.]